MLTFERRLKAMAKKKKVKGIIYSTNPDYEYDFEEEEAADTPEPSRQNLRISVQRLKGNKLLTKVYNFVGSEEDLKVLGKHLKNKCGCGGSVKNGEILLQGDFREKIGKELSQMGYKYKFSGG